MTFWHIDKNLRSRIANCLQLVGRSGMLAYCEYSHKMVATVDVAGLKIFLGQGELRSCHSVDLTLLDQLTTFPVSE